MARTLKNKILHATRALHTYMTMLALILLVFFSFTGFTLNHPGFFDLERYAVVNQVAKVALPAKLLTDRGGLGTEHGYQLEAYLRQNEEARGELKSIDDEDESIEVHFQGAGSRMDYSISRAADSGGKDVAGRIEEHYETRHVVAMLSDMHRGIGTGVWWRLLIDGAAIFLMFAALSGVVLWISMPKRRVLGIVALVAGVGLSVVCYLFLMA